ncbi:MAG: hypothetical protein ABR567_05260 [Myxococcales bacterium]
MHDPWRRRRALAIGLGCAVALFVLLQPGNTLDEAEHLHAAWLIAHGGLRPIQDFFEHHTPLFWHFLGLIFRAGGDGPEVLYAGRVLMLACAGVWTWSLVSLARRWAPPGSREPQTGLFAVCVFALITTFAQDLIVVRPETLSLALLGPALVAWTRRSLVFAAVAGVLIGLSICASPRFVLFAPMLALTGFSPRRTAVAAAAACATGTAFVLALCPWQELLFDVRFSGLLQHAGHVAVLIDQRYVSALILLVVFVAGALFRSSRATLLWCLYGAGLLAICWATAGQYLYPQAFAPVLAWVPLFVAWLESQPAADAAQRRRFLDLTLYGSLPAATLMLWFAVSNYYSATAVTASRRILLDALPAGSRVFLLPRHHPITVADATYWGTILLTDAPGQICEAVDDYRARYPDAAVKLPACDFVADLRRARPAVVSRQLPMAGPQAQFFELTALIDKWYAPADKLDAAPTLPFASNVYFLREQGAIRQ